MSTFTMSQPADAQANGAHDGPTAAMRWIGELDHPFYDDERNRHIWYEGQAIAFQFVALASYFAAGVALFVAGASALPYMIPLLAPFLMAVILLKAWVGRHGADYWPRMTDLRRSRGLAVVAVTVFLYAGFARAYMETDSASATILGLIVGGSVAGAMLAFRGNRQAKQEAAELYAPDED